MVRVSAEAVTRSEKDAGALEDVVRFIAGIIQLNKEYTAASGVSSLMDTMVLNTAGNVMTLSLSIPEAQLENMLNSGKAEARHTASK